MNVPELQTRRCRGRRLPGVPLCIAPGREEFPAILQSRLDTRPNGCGAGPPFLGHRIPEIIVPLANTLAGLFGLCLGFAKILLIALLNGLQFGGKCGMCLGQCGVAVGDKLRFALSIPLLGVFHGGIASGSRLGNFLLELRLRRIQFLVAMGENSLRFHRAAVLCKNQRRAMQLRTLLKFRVKFFIGC